MLKVLVASRLLAFAEGEWYGDLAAGFEPLSPEAVGSHLHGGERHGSDRIAAESLLCLRGQQHDYGGSESQKSFHKYNVY